MVSCQPGRHIVLRCRYQPNHVSAARRRKIRPSAIIHRRKARKPQQAVGQRRGRGDSVAGILNPAWKNEPDRSIVRVRRSRDAAKIQHRHLPRSSIHFNHVRPTFTQGQRCHGLGRSGAIVPLNLKRSTPHIQIRQFPKLHGVARRVVQYERSRVNRACPSGGQRAVVTPEPHNLIATKLLDRIRARACQIGIDDSLIQIEVSSHRQRARPVDRPCPVEIAVTQQELRHRLVEIAHVQDSSTTGIKRNPQTIKLSRRHRVICTQVDDTPSSGPEARIGTQGGRIEGQSLESIQIQGRPSCHREIITYLEQAARQIQDRRRSRHGQVIANPAYPNLMMPRAAVYGHVSRISQLRDTTQNEPLVACQSTQYQLVAITSPRVRYEAVEGQSRSACCVVCQRTVRRCCRDDAVRRLTRIASKSQRPPR